MSRWLNTLLWVLLLLPAGHPAASAEPTPAQKARGALEVAKSYADVEDWERARKFLETALQTVPEDPEVRAGAAEVLRKIQAGEQPVLQARQRAILREARRLAASGETEKAREMIKLESFEPPLLAEAERELAAIHRGWLLARGAAFLRQDWLFDTILLVSFLCLLLWVFRWYTRRQYRKEWLITSITDPTDLGIGLLASERLLRWSEESVGASTGLLRLEALRVQSLPRLSLDHPEVALPAALAELPALGKVDLGTIGRALAAIRRWAHGHRPTITVTVHELDQQVLVRLTRREPAGKVYTVSAAGAKSFEGSVSAVDSASFKMYYLLANQASLPDAEAADQLRLGLERLRRYLTQRDFDALKSAYDLFRTVRAQNPGFEEAGLYEGVTLDLMERHDEAESIFRLLAAQGERSDIQEKALYNEAVAQFRKYRPADLERAIEKLDQLIGAEILVDLQASPPRTERLARSPIRAMAVAARANAIAHKPIFWQTLLYQDKTDDPAVLRQRKNFAQGSVMGWLEEVRAISEALLNLSDESLKAQAGWDPLARKQLRWSAHNALGNVALSIAVRFLMEPELPGNNEPQRQQSLLRTAYREFEECQAILPPSVETLTNMATVLLSLSRLEEARDYAQQAIATNPDYEYAHYRLAEIWEKKGEPEKVVETLRSFLARRQPRIPEFKAVFDKYYLDIASL